MIIYSIYSARKEWFCWALRSHAEI